MEWMATANARKRVAATAQPSVSTDGEGGILGAARREAAVTPQKRRNGSLIKRDQPKEQIRQRPAKMGRQFLAVDRAQSSSISCLTSWKPSAAAFCLATNTTSVARGKAALFWR